MHSLTSILRWLLGLSYKPSYRELAEQVVTLQKDVASLRSIAKRAMVDLESSDSLLIRQTAVHATILRWPRSERLMTQNRLMLLADAAKKRRSRHRFQYRRFCERYGVKVAEFKND